MKPYLPALLISLTLALSGCSTLSNLVEKPESEWTVADYYQHLKDAYDNEQWEQVTQYGEKLLAYYPYGKEAEQAYLYLAYAYYKWDEPQSAIRTLNEFIRLYPKHRALPWAYYLRARAAEKVVASWFDSWLTDPARRSAEALKEALTYYKAIVEKFPHSPYAEIARTKVIVFYNRLARHEFLVAQFYFKKGAYLAAANRVQDLLKNYPRAVITTDAINLMAAAFDRLDMDVQAEHARTVLIAQFHKQVQRQPRQTLEQRRKLRQLEQVPPPRSLRWSSTENP